tara:strand:- start:4647 stop:5309 length:663 start_codon:yes stop_codon:yes gene_type:complete
MKIIHSIILARGGSKGIKKKNIVKINNKPLIYWSIRKSINSKKVSMTWVSSDNNEILKVAKKNGAKIIKRPKKISGNNSSSELAWLHAIKFIEKKYKIDCVLGIQPTSPIREKNDFDNAISKFIKKKFDSLFSANRFYDFNFWYEKNNKLIANYDPKKRKMRQKIKEKFLENGSFYIFDKKKFLQNKVRLFGKIGIYEMKKKCQFQIDEIEDIEIVKKFL